MSKDKSVLNFKNYKKIKTLENWEGENTYSFPIIPGEKKEAIRQKIKTGYVEIPEIIDVSPNDGYKCGNCEYLMKSENSPTGYICRKFKYFDAPHGCCSGWELHPKYRKVTGV